MNALQRQAFKKVDALAESGDLSREDYAILNERMEYNSFLFRSLIGQILNLRDQQSFPFNELWRLLQTPQLVAHPDKYRYMWDARCASAYVKKHPEVFKGWQAAMTAAVSS